MKKRNFEIEVYGESWKVEFTTDIVDPKTGEPGDGLCDADNKIIYIDNTLKKDETACTFFHELFHAYCRRMGIENSNLSDELEEILADQYGKLVSELFDFDIWD